MNEHQNQLPPMMWLSFVPAGARNVPRLGLNEVRMLEIDDEFDRRDGRGSVMRSSKAG